LTGSDDGLFSANKCDSSVSFSLFTRIKALKVDWVEKGRLELYGTYAIPTLESSTKAALRCELRSRHSPRIPIAFGAALMVFVQFMLRTGDAARIPFSSSMSMNTES
jgi:hypothetical protein